MGRFYKTSKPELTDFMYKLPEKALFAAVETADKKYEDQVKYLTDLEKYLKVNAQEADVSRRDELLKEADAKIKDFTYKLQSSPSAALNSMGEIRGFGQKLHEDYTRGELAGIGAAYDAEEAWVKQETERMTKDKGRVLTADIEDFRRVFNENYNKPIYETIVDPETGKETKKFTGYGGGLGWDPKTRKSKNSFATENIANYIDAEDVATKAVIHWKEDSDKIHNTQVKGNYLVSTVDGKVVANANDIYNTAYDALKNNDELMGRYNQRVKYGLMSEEDLYGKINPKTGEHVGYPIIDKETKKPIINKETGEPEVHRDEFGRVIPVNGGVLYKTAMGAAKEFGFNRTESGITGLQETEEYKQSLQLDKEKQMATFKLALEKPQIDKENQETVLSTYNLTDDNGNPVAASRDALNKNIARKKDGLNNKAANTQLSIMKSLPADKQLKFNELWTAAVKSGNFKAVSKFATENDIGLKDGSGRSVGNAVEEFSKEFVSMNTKLNNEARLLENTIDETAIRLAKEDIARNKESIYKPGTKDYDAEVFKRANNYKIDYEAAQKDPVKSMLIQFHPMEKGVNTTLSNSYQDNKKYTVITSANSMGDQVTQADRDYYNVQMAALAKNFNLHDLMGEDGSGRVFIGANTTGKPTSFTDFLKENNITAANLTNMTSDGTIEIEGKDGKKQSIQVKTDFGIIPEDVQGVGSQARHVKVTLQKKNDDGTYSLEDYTVVMPKKSIKLEPRLEKITSVLSAQAEAKNLEAQGNTMYRHSGNQMNNVDKEKQFIESELAPECRVYPNETGPGGQGKWVINGRVIYGDAGRKAYGEYLQQQGIISSDYTPGEYNNLIQTGTSSSSSSYKRN